MDGKTVIRRDGGASGRWGAKIKRAETLGGKAPQGQGELIGQRFSNRMFQGQILYHS